ncbi:MAG: heparinase II/III family protein, partial [Balneolaceae bacterium]
HTGYDNLNVRHNREWRIMENKVEIIDCLEGNEADGIAYLHFHPSVQIEQIEEGIFSLNNHILSFEDFIEIKKENYSFCSGFNKTELGDVIKVKFKEALKTKIKE